ncbi:MAG: 3-oxoacyl-ACP synthase [Deltaproteobacteria bacterium]|nr:3-oxoacyl-ACP synthase [Deltaproteobacteria bacterium]
MSEIVAVGAVSALGIGSRAYAVAQPGAAARSAIGPDGALGAAGLARPNAARAVRDLGIAPSADRACDLLHAALVQVLEELGRVVPSWRSRRLGLALGTSSGGMLCAERFFAARAEHPSRPSAATARGASYFAPLWDAAQRAGLRLPGATGPASGVDVVKLTQVLAACASSTIALGLGHRWLQRGACDLVLAGGYDGVSPFVAAGFEALRATTASRPQPFRLGRDGMALGEGAAVVALVRAGEAAGALPLASLSGFGAASDAFHITAPDPAGAGLVRAAGAALADADCAAERVDLVSAHGTATPYNDAAEARAIAAIAGVRAGPGPVVHAFKAEIGHTLGAAGVLEAMCAADALRAQVAPATAGEAPLDPDAAVCLLARGRAQELRAALKLSAAFGGATAALVLEPAGRAPRPRPRRRVFAVAAASVAQADRDALCRIAGIARERLARIDELSQLGLAAVAALVARAGRDALRGAGVVAGHGLATLDINERFNARLLQRGARWVDPRLFPATSPNAVSGHCAIAFGLTGPSFAVGAGLRGGLEALLAAAELVAAGDAERMLVVAADDAGPAARQLLDLAGEPSRQLRRGAAAVLLQGADAPPAGAIREVELDMPVEHGRGPVGHLGLAEWARGA